MSSNPFRKSSIKSISSKLFKGGIGEKESLAKTAGSTGFSQTRMKKELKNAGYDPTKRGKIIDSVLGLNKPEKKSRRPIINRAKDISALEKGRANISALGRVGKQASGFANSPKPASGSANSGVPSPPSNSGPKPGPGQGLTNF